MIKYLDQEELLKTLKNWNIAYGGNLPNAHITLVSPA